MGGECRTLVGDGKYVRSFNLKTLKKEMIRFATCSSVTVRHWTSEESGFEPWQGQESVAFCKLSIPPLRRIGHLFEYHGKAPGTRS